MTTVYIDRLHTPLGGLLLAHAGSQLFMLDFEGYEHRFDSLLLRRFGNVLVHEKPATGDIREPLLAYIDGEFDALQKIPVHATGTSFQRLVWDMLRQIPAGVTWTYAQLAAAIRRPEAVRAVAMANAHNPVAIVVPCHRVIGSNGELTGYAGGLERKRWLLAHEGITLPVMSPRPLQAQFYF
jgi:methylated-DNA-[protein]-cysteine S-methyltransferase